MKAVVIYKGKYGATKQYALWLGDELGIPVRNANIINRDQLAPFDTLLIGTSVYVGKLQIRNWLKYNLEYIRGKRIVLFQVAGSPVDQIEKRLTYNVAGIPSEIVEQCEFYFLPGRLVIKDLSWKDRFMLRMGARLAKDPQDKKTMLTDYDHVKKEHLTELVTAIKNRMTGNAISIKDKGVLSLISARLH
jgi:menaquinone-dependent protoporphyrinogen IX oxidase